jgi:hypothetical protein
VNIKTSLLKWNTVLPIIKFRKGEICSIAIGIATFGALTNWKILNPLFVRWLYWGDPTSSYLGWQFFRKTPPIQFPLGASPRYGVGFASSILYSESIPLIAIPLKYISFLFPHNFQYFGIWIFSAIILQSWFAWKLISKFIPQLPIALFGVVLFTNAPILIYRLVHNGSGHLGFVGQFVILCAINLSLETGNNRRKWLILLAVTTLISLFFVPMVFFIYLLWILKNMLFKSAGHLKQYVFGAINLLTGLIVVIGTLWTCGGLMSSDLSDSGFGRYRTTLSSVFDPQVNGVFSFSRIIPNSGNIPGTEEGFAFLGVSVFILLATSFVMLFRSRNPLLTRNCLPLVLGTVAMAVYSLSNRVAIFQREIFSYPIPRQLKNITETFRSSGRFVWPLVYILILFGLISLSLLWNHSRNFGLTLLLIAFSVQMLDSLDIYSHVQHRFSDIQFDPQLTSPKWDQTAKNYEHLIVIPPLNNDPGWFELSLLADKWGLSTNATYLGRINRKSFEDEKAKVQRDLEALKFDQKTLYVITNYPPNPMNQIVLEKYGSTNLGHTKAFSLDGFTVIAP